MADTPATLFLKAQGIAYTDLVGIAPAEIVRTLAAVLVDAALD